MNDEEYVIIDTDEKRQKYAPMVGTDEYQAPMTNQWSPVLEHGCFSPHYIYRRLRNQPSANHAWILAPEMKPKYPCWIGWFVGGRWTQRVECYGVAVEDEVDFWWTPIQTPPPRPSMEDSAFKKAWNGYTGHDRGLTPYHVARYFFLTGALAAREAKP